MSILDCPPLPDHKFPVSAQKSSCRLLLNLKLRSITVVTIVTLIPAQRWFVNGNIGCFTGWHIPLALLAIAVLVMAVLLVPLVCLISLKHYLIQVHILLN
jgi:hypothetical protein